jgi:hypothetical protein
MVTVELVDDAGYVWVKSSGPVLAAGGPSTVEGHYQLTMPAEITRDNYNLQVSVGDVSRIVGSIPVRHLDMPPVEYETQAKFGDQITFVGANLGSTAIPAKEPVELELVWQARQPVPFAYTTFVHLVDEAGQMWGQVDRVPGDGRWPTTEWEPGEWIIDKFELTPAPDTPPGMYKLIVGVYNSRTIERLPVQAGGEGQYDTVVEITSIEVTAD